MKKYFFFILILFLIFNSGFAQNGNGMWTWMHGDTIGNTSAVYGIQGFSLSLNKPAGTYDAVYWKDKNGKFWMYGGAAGYNDMWMFDPLTNEWTWESGAHSGFENLGTIGVPSASNSPGTVLLGACHWTDTTGNLWMFGGGLDASSSSNKLWKYDIATNQWTWMRGTSPGNRMGVYGTVGVADSLNDPCSRYKSIGWIDNENNLWLFGGCYTSQYNDYLNDVWKYNIAANEWTWISGKDPHTNWNSVPINFGTIGVPSPTNTPGSRYCCATWTDTAGNPYLFGGMTENGTQSPYYYNDFWKFDLSLNQWICLRANGATHNYLNSPTCVPEEDYCLPGNYFSCAYWTDTCGNFWLFGGSRDLLWNYNVVMNKWTLINNVTYNKPLYGTYQIPSPTNHIGYRNRSCSWIGDDGKLWLFGGYYQRQVGSTWYDVRNNDMWVFSADTNCSTCSTFNYNVHSDFNHTYPNSYCLPVAYDFSNESMNATNYLWDFGDNDTSTAMNPSHTYDSAGIFQVTLIVSNEFESDTTIYILHEMYSVPVADFSADDTTGCIPFTIQTTNLSSPGIWTYYWDFDEYYNSTSTTENPSYTYHNQGIYNLMFIVSNSLYAACRDTATATVTVNPSPVANAGADRSLCEGNATMLYLSGSLTYEWSDGVINGELFYPVQTETYSLTVTNSYDCSATDSLIIYVNPLPPTPDITQNADSLLSSSIFGNQWYNNSIAVSGANDYFYIPVISGNYSVIVTDSNACKSDTSNMIPVVITGNINLATNEDAIVIYPNPANNILNIVLSGNSRIELSSIEGTPVFFIDTEENNLVMDISGLASGIYFLKIFNQNGILVKKFIKQ